MTTLYTAKKYAVPALEAHCVEFLKKNLRADNAFMLLTQARLCKALQKSLYPLCWIWCIFEYVKKINKNIVVRF